MKTLRIATRKSALALWQANFVAAQLKQAHPGLDTQLVPLVSKGDKILDIALNKVGGKGLFVKELEHALLDERADIAVHSMKDVPMFFPEGLYLPVTGAREDPRDAFVSNKFSSWQELTKGACVGTSSLRRQSQLLALRPDLQIKFLRGNVNTRLSKLDKGEYDAIILAAAGLKRLEFSARIASYLEPNACLPAAGQGALGVEARTGDDETEALISVLHDPKTAACVNAERAVVKTLNGGCQVPIAAYAELHEQTLKLRTLVGNDNGTLILEESGEAIAADAEALGVQLAEKLLEKGAAKILRAHQD